jgi:hypothetical protein
MANKHALVRQADLTRLIKGTEKAGVVVGRIEARPDGSVVITPLSATVAENANPFDQLLKP